MIYSMTGYAARTLDVERGALHIELKSVNSRYLDFQFRICEELRVVEPALRELFSARRALLADHPGPHAQRGNLLSRGKTDGFHG